VDAATILDCVAIGTPDHILVALAQIREGLEEAERVAAGMGIVRVTGKGSEL
jgi:hypothetical protein